MNGWEDMGKTTFEIYFVVEGEIVGKGRPRVTMRGGYARAYTPKKTADCEQRIREAYSREYSSPIWTNKEPLEMVINVYYEVPNSVSRKQRDQMLLGDIRPTKKPDADNLFKTCADALNNLAYGDDSQIVIARINKWYAEKAGAEITIREVKHGRE